MVSKPCCHPESTLFVRTKDPGAPRNHSRVRCENANQRVWRASLTPPTTSCSNTTEASCACRLGAPSPRRSNSCKCHLSANGVPYRRDQVDFIAAYVITADVWYIVPVRATRGQPDILLSPHRPHSNAAATRKPGASCFKPDHS